MQNDGKTGDLPYQLHIVLHNLCNSRMFRCCKSWRVVKGCDATSFCKWRLCLISQHGRRLDGGQKCTSIASDDRLHPLRHASDIIATDVSRQLLQLAKIYLSKLVVYQGLSHSSEFSQQSICHLLHCVLIRVRLTMPRGVNSSNSSRLRDQT